MLFYMRFVPDSACRALWRQIIAYLELVFCIMFFYAQIGVALFGGRINTDPDRPEAIGGPSVTNELANSPFGQAAYYPNNYNDLASGWVVCFEILIVNNWCAKHSLCVDSFAPCAPASSHGSATMQSCTLHLSGSTPSTCVGPVSKIPLCTRHAQVHHLERL